MQGLTSHDLLRLIETAFPRLAGDRALGLLVDLPSHREQDHPDWRERREMAAQWHAQLVRHAAEIDLQAVELYAYQNTGLNNADLPEKWLRVSSVLPDTVEDMASCGEMVDAADVLRQTQLFLAPTEYSATAPLKIMGKQFGFRAATMPGFSADMLPALRVDYERVCSRLELLKQKLDRADGVQVCFQVDGHHGCKLYFDLRHRQATVSSGRFLRPGDVGNLPSGETYIVPYEGEKGSDSKTEGVLPVQFDKAVLFFQVQQNRARSVRGDRDAVQPQAQMLGREPAYGNMAELGFGVLADFGIRPVGKILLDEKLGFHVAFGRSDHFGGFVGAGQFSQPANMVHIDYIYLPACQPRISVRELSVCYPDQSQERLMRDDRYTLFGAESV